MSGEVGPKRLELLHEVVPAATLIGLLLNPTNPVTEAFLRGQQAGARILGVQLHVLYASTERDFDAAFATLVQVRAGGSSSAWMCSSAAEGNSLPHWRLQAWVGPMGQKPLFSCTFLHTA